MGPIRNQRHSHLLNGKSKCKSKCKCKMPNIKLYYGEFPFWRAEVSRLALHLGKVPFENVTSMNLQALRESGKATLGQMPILEVDGKTSVQTGLSQGTVASSLGSTPGTTTGPLPRLMRSLTLQLILRFQWGRPLEWKQQRKQLQGLSLLPPPCQST